MQKIVLILGLVAAVGCQCKTRKMDQEGNLDKAVHQQAPADSADEIAHRGAEAFINSPNLTPEQKQKVMMIYARVYSEATAIRREIGQSKSLMFQLVAQKKFKSPEVTQLKNKIVKLDKKRLEVMFKALEDVQDAVGYGPGKEEIYKHFYDYEVPRHTGVSKL